MHDIRTLLKLAARRLQLNSFIGVLHWVAVFAAAIALALMIADRAPAQYFVPWKWVGPAIVGAALLAAVLIWLRRRPSELHVAVEVDDRLDLREKISTALLCEGRDDVFARAAIEDAVNTARDPRSRETVRRRFGITPPRGWWASPAILLAVLMVSFLGPWDLFGRNAAAQQNIQQAKNESDQSLKAIAKVVAEKPELSKELRKELGEISKEGPDPAVKTPDKITQDAMKKATQLNKKLDDLINGEKGKTADAMEKALNQLKPPENGPGKELSDALAKGDFKAAQQALKNLQDKMQNGQLTDDQKKALAEQLENLAKQMEKLANDQKKLEDALKQAGLDPQLAQNAQALQQALDQNKNLNEQQKQQLQQMAQAQQAACQACKGMSQACSKMGQGCKPGGQNGQQMGQFQQGASQMGDQLSQLESLQQLLQEAKLAQGECKGACMGLSQCMSQFSGNKVNLKDGPDVGGRGNAAGGKGQFAPTPFSTKQQKADTKNTEGDIIAKELFDGEIVRGESKAKLVEAKIAEAKGLDEGITEEQLPRQYQEAHKHYFGELDKLTKARPDDSGKKSDAKPADKPADKPAEGSNTGGDKPAESPKPGS